MSTIRTVLHLTKHARDWLGGPREKSAAIHTIADLGMSFAELVELARRRRSWRRMTDTTPADLKGREAVPALIFAEDLGQYFVGMVVLFEEDDLDPAPPDVPAGIGWCTEGEGLDNTHPRHMVWREATPPGQYVV